MRNKLAAVTGANDGIGYATSKRLVEKGFSLVMFCRDIEKAEKAKSSLSQQPNIVEIEIIQVDFSSFKSIKSACSLFTSKYDYLDLLVNNAGVMQSDFQLSEDGIEMTMAVNHFGSFLMTYYLLDSLRKAKQGRIVNLASRAHFGVSINLEKINKEKYFNFRRQYKLSKLANVLFTLKLSEFLKGSNVTCNCLDPGLVKTEIGNKTNSTLFSWAWKLFSLRGVSPDKGAETVIYLSISGDVERISGKYFEENKVAKTSVEANNVKQMNELWEWTINKCGIKSWEF